MKGDTEAEWEFEESDIIRQEHEQFAPGGVELGKSEYKIKRRLIDESEGERFYHVETQENGTHLYSSGAIEHSYEVIDPEESRAFGGDDDGLF